MDYSTFSNEELFIKLKENIRTLSTIAVEIFSDDCEPGETPVIDVSQIATDIEDLTLEEFMKGFTASKEYFLKTLDLQTIATQITLENFDITRELITRG